MREEELVDLQKLAKKYCPVGHLVKIIGIADACLVDWLHSHRQVKIMESIDTDQGKTNILLQVYISQGTVEESTLISGVFCLFLLKAILCVCALFIVRCVACRFVLHHTVCRAHMSCSV